LAWLIWLDLSEVLYFLFIIGQSLQGKVSWLSLEALPQLVFNQIECGKTSQVQIPSQGILGTLISGHSEDW
jgi:hypothetical protein